MLYFNQMIEIRGSAMHETHITRRERGDGTRSIHRDERRRSLILAAYQLIAEKGFEHLRTRDIASRAGVNIATLHYYFANKEDLIPGVVDHMLHEFRTFPDSADEMGETSPLDQIHAMFQRTGDRFQAKPELFIALSELVLRSLRDATIQPALQQLDEEWHRYLQYLLTDGMRQGTFRADLDPAAMATKLIILIKGFFFHRVTSPDSIDFHQLDTDVERLLLS